MAVVRLTLGLRSPLAFQLPADDTTDVLSAPPDPVGIEFEGRKFVWHPPIDYEDPLGQSQYGPMVATLTTNEGDYRAAEQSLHRLLSALAFEYGQPVDAGDSGVGGDGESDAFHPQGARIQRSHPYIYKTEAPAAIVVHDDQTLRLALSYYREGMNASSPFYSCVAFRNVLDAVYEVEYETKQKIVTPEAAARDAFIDSEAPRFAAWAPTPGKGWAEYLRDEVRNALAHVRRTGRREVNPDDPIERTRLLTDSRVLQSLAKTAIEQRWPNGVTSVPTSGPPRLELSAPEQAAPPE